MCFACVLPSRAAPLRLVGPTRGSSSEGRQGEEGPVVVPLRGGWGIVLTGGCCGAREGHSGWGLF